MERIEPEGPGSYPVVSQWDDKQSDAMRVLALVLAFLVPTIASAQANGQAEAVSPPMPWQTLPLDGSPAEHGADATGLLLAAGVGFTLGFFLSLEEGVGRAILQGAICGAAMAGCAMIGWPEADGALAEAVVAYDSGTLTDGQRQHLAATARASGHHGVVLQRLVETRAGVGDVPSEIALEIVVLDAETARFRPVTDDLLAPQTVLSLPVSSPDDLAAVQAEAFARLGIDA